jgi:hypothetical protein
LLLDDQAGMCDCCSFKEIVMPALAAPLVELAVAHVAKKLLDKGAELLGSNAAPSMATTLAAERPVPGLGANNPAPK